MNKANLEQMLKQKQKQNFKMIVENVNEEEKTKMFTISTESVDRMGDIVVAQGLELDVPQPPVLFNHNHNMQIGRAIWVKPEDKKVKSQAKFNPKSALAMEVYDSIPEFYDSSSIGFDPIDMGMIDKDGKETNDWDEWYGWIFKKWKLFEWSVVTVPANPEAVSTDKSIEMYDAVKRAYTKGYMEIGKALESDMSYYQLVDIIDKKVDAVLKDMNAMLTDKLAGFDNLQKAIGVILKDKRSNEQIKDKASEVIIKAPVETVAVKRIEQKDIDGIIGGAVSRVITKRSKTE